MKGCHLYLILLLLVSGYQSYIVTSQHVPIKGVASHTSKVELAKKVLAALPEEKVREAIDQRFPQLTAKELESVHLSHTQMEMHLQEGVRQEVHLVVSVVHDDTLHPLAHQIQKLVQSM